MDLRQQIESYISQNIIMQLATSTDNKPWCCNLHYSFDENLNLFWVSLQTTKHSRDISINPNVAATIAKPHSPTDPPQGLQIEGTAKKVEEELETICEIIISRYPHLANRKEELLNKNKDGFAIYALKPKKIIMFDRVTPGVEPKRELVL